MTIILFYILSILKCFQLIFIKIHIDGNAHIQTPYETSVNFANVFKNTIWDSATKVYLFEPNLT